MKVMVLLHGHSQLSWCVIKQGQVEWWNMPSGCGRRGGLMSFYCLCNPYITGFRRRKSCIFALLLYWTCFGYTVQWFLHCFMNWQMPSICHAVSEHSLNFRLSMFEIIDSSFCNQRITSWMHNLNVYSVDQILILVFRFLQPRFTFIYNICYVSYPVFNSVDLLLLIAIVSHHNLPCFRATLLRQSFRHTFVLKERDCPSRSVGTQYNITHSFSCFSYTGIAKCAIRHFYVEENGYFLSLFTELELHLLFVFRDIHVLIFQLAPRNVFFN